MAAAAAFLLLRAAGCGASGLRRLDVKVTDDGFEPASLVIRKGDVVDLVLTRESDATCATSAIFTETGQKYELPLHEGVHVPIQTDDARTYHFSCPMDMYHGQIVVR